MGLLSREMSPIGTSMPIPSSCRSRFPSLSHWHLIRVLSIAQQGPDVFYTGQIAENTVSGKFLSDCVFLVHVVLKSRSCPAVQERGGIITLEDLKNYTAITRTPVNITYRGNRIFSTVAPSSGAVVLSALKIFEGYPAAAKIGDPGYDIQTHRLIQATRFGYGQRTNYGDPAYTANVSALERLACCAWAFFVSC